MRHREHEPTKREKNRDNTVSIWALFQTYAKNIYEGNQEWKLHHFSRTQQSKIVKTLINQYCNLFKAPGSGAQEPSVDEESQIQVGY